MKDVDKAEQLDKELCKQGDAEDKEASTDEALFHYTTFSGLQDILQTKRLWLTDYNYLNDPSEIKYGKALILSAIDKYVPSSNIQLISRFKQLVDDIVETSYITYIVAFL